MSAAIDRDRASELLKEAGLEALVLCEPEAVSYATGGPVAAASLFRRAGACFAVVPRQVDAPIGLVVPDYDAPSFAAASPDLLIRTHPSWIDFLSTPHAAPQLPLEQRIEAAFAVRERHAGFRRPETFDSGISAAQLAALLVDLDIPGGRIGFDLSFVAVADWSAIRSRLGGYQVIDGTTVLERLRAIKTRAEIGLLQLGIDLSEAGMSNMLSSAAAGMTKADLITLYRAGVEAASEGCGHAVSTKEYVHLVKNRPDGPIVAADRGDAVKADMICTVDGYSADMSRNFVFAPATPDQIRLHAIAEAAFERGLALLTPGRSLGDVYSAVSESLAAQGIPSYRRGHFGHGVGNSVFSEQWPFISAGSMVTIEPGMVLAFEIPLYVDGIAHFNLEDQFLITHDGAVSMNRMARQLTVV